MAADSPANETAINLSVLRRFIVFSLSGQNGFRVGSANHRAIYSDRVSAASAFPHPGCFEAFLPYHRSGDVGVARSRGITKAIASVALVLLALAASGCTTSLADAR